MMTTSYDNVNGQISFHINVGRLARGTYFLVVTDSNGQKTVRQFVKQ
jgi:hypothetical protein